MATDAIHPAPPAKRIWPHERIARLGTQQALLIAHGQLRQLGVGARTINRAVDRRQLHPYRHRGIYGLVEPSALPPLAAEHAAVLVGGPAAMLSHLSALWLWDLLDPHDPPIAPDPVQLTVVGAETARRRPGLEMHRAGRFWRNERRRRRALPVASPALALLDSVPLLSQRRFENALDTALDRRITTRAALKQTAARHPNRAGVGLLWALLDPNRPSSRTESPPHERLLAAILATDLPRPETEQWIGPYRVDLMWRAERVVLEVKGRRWHDTRERWEYDHIRENWIRSQRWRLIPVTATEADASTGRVLVWIATELGNARAAQNRGAT